MLASATRAGTTPPSTKPGTVHGAGAGVSGTPVVAAGQHQEVTVSQFVAQLDEAARRRLDSMYQRLMLLEQQMETLEAEVGKAASSSARMDTYAPSLSRLE